MIKWATAAVMIGCATVVPLGAMAAGSAAGRQGARNGPIAFVRFDPTTGNGAIYTVTANRHRVRPLFTRATSEMPHWSPSGRLVALFCCDDGMAAHLVDRATHAFRELASPDRALEMHCGFSWSPDSRRLSCETFGISDPRRNGVYSIRASDGRGLRRISVNPGGDDIPGDFSPAGGRIVFARSNPSGPTGLFVATIGQRRVRRLTPTGMLIDGEFGGRWSPTGNHILFTARRADDRRRAIWVVNADGGHLHQLPIRPACGGLRTDPRSSGCFEPDWSPDGTKIVFTRLRADGTRDLYTARADGSHVAELTTSGDAGEADWGRRRS